MNERVGRSFLFDYGAFAVKVRYVSETSLTWEVARGPGAGTQGTEAYTAVAVRPDVHFIRWQEADSSVIAQVVDLGRLRVYATWVSPG
jgi:hypothetical protein